MLQVDGIDDHPEVAPLKNAFARVKEDKANAVAERDALKAKIKGIPEDFDAEVWERTKSGNFDEAAFSAKLAEVRTQLETERDDWKGKYEAQEAAAERKTIQEQVMGALAANKVPEGPRKAAALAMLEGQDVKLSSAGVMVDTDMGPQTLQDFTKRWVATDGAWSVPTPSGGDAPGGNASGSAAPNSWSEAKTPAEKVAMLKAKQQ